MLNTMFYSRLILLFCCSIFIGCISESAETIYVSNDIEAKEFYNQSLKSIIDSKCLSCHIYHLEGANKYDTFEKTKSNIVQMSGRINATSNIVMPPLNSVVLSIDEKNAFQEFLTILSSNEIGSSNKVKINWTAYKFPDFNSRAPVSGTFDEINFSLNNDYVNPVDILKDAIVTVNTAYVNVGNDAVKTQNVGVFFSNFTSEVKGTIVSHTETIALIRFTMNFIEQEVYFDITKEVDKIILSGEISDMNFFNWQEGYNALATVCGDYHQDKVWEDIKLIIEILL
jgi:hypothetical protein